MGGRLSHLRRLQHRKGGPVSTESARIYRLAKTKVTHGLRQLEGEPSYDNAMDAAEALSSAAALCRGYAEEELHPTTPSVSNEEAAS